MSLVEFGRPKTSVAAWVRLPDRSHPEYGKEDGNPYEHVAHLREFLVESVITWASGNFDKLFLEDRMAPAITPDLSLMFNLNSFYRCTDKETFTADWSAISDETNPWALVLPFGYEEYRWWQITHFDPDFNLGNYRLYCIEMNNRFVGRKTDIRYDKNSEFELVFATREEIESLKKLLNTNY